MNFRTFYISSCGQPANNIQLHESFFEALNSWWDNCGALLVNAGGASILELVTDKNQGDSPEPSEHRLIWRETAEESYPVGEGWFQDYVDDVVASTESSERELTPEYVAEWIAKYSDHEDLKRS